MTARAWQLMMAEEPTPEQKFTDPDNVLAKILSRSSLRTKSFSLKVLRHWHHFNDRHHYAFCRVHSNANEYTSASLMTTRSSTGRPTRDSTLLFPFQLTRRS